MINDEWMNNIPSDWPWLPPLDVISVITVITIIV